MKKDIWILAERIIDHKNELRIYKNMGDLHDSGFDYDYIHMINVQSTEMSPRYKKEVTMKLKRNRNVNRNLRNR